MKCWILSYKHQFDLHLRTELNLLPCAILSPISSSLYYWSCHSVYGIIIHCCDDPVMFLCCSWKRICTIRVSWDCVCIILFACAFSTQSYCHQVCHTESSVLNWDDICIYFSSRYFRNIDVLLPHYLKKMIQFWAKLYILQGIAPAFFAVTLNLK